MYDIMVKNSVYSKFKQERRFEDRIKESKNIINKYPDRIPVIVEKHPREKALIEIDKCKYLIPMNITVGQLLHIIRKRLQISEIQAIYIFFNNRVFSNTTMIHTIYETEKDDDGFLYVKYCAENTFG